MVTDQSSPVLREVVGALHAAFSAGDATAATALFTADAVFEDLTLHTRLAGPLTIGNATLETGETVKCFLCEHYALSGATEITQFGGWRAFLASEAVQASV